jgi:two-component system sensor histidine kinase EvgS
MTKLPLFELLICRNSDKSLVCLRCFGINLIRFSLIAFLVLIGSNNPSVADISVPTATKQDSFPTAEQKAWIQAHPSIKYAAERDWPPYDFVDNDGNHTGFSYELLQLVSKYSGLNFQPVISDWNDLLLRGKNKQLDVFPSIFYSPERAKYLDFTPPYQSALSYFFIHETVSAKTFDDLNGKTIAIPKGYAQVDQVKQRFPKLKIVETSSLFDAIQLVIERKADILLEMYPVMSFVLKKHAIIGIKPFRPFPAVKPQALHIAVRKDLPVLSEIINKTLLVIPEPEMQALVNKWLEYASVNQTNERIQLNPEELQWLYLHPEIRFTGDPSLLPYEAIDKQGRYIGIVSEYLHLIEQKLNIKFDIVHSTTWNEAVNKAKQGQVDVLSETVDSDLKSSLLFTQAYLTSPVVIVMRDDEGYVENINQIKNRRLAVIANHGNNSEIFQSYTDIHFFQVENMQRAFTALSAGQIDALLCTLSQASYQISNQNLNNIRIVGKTEFTTQLGLGVRKEYAPLVAILDKALNSISPGEKQKINDLWGKVNVIDKVDYLVIARIVAGFLIVLLLVFLWIRRLTNEIARRKSSEKKVTELNQRFALATGVASLGVWELDVDESSGLIFDDKMFEIYGISKRQQLDLDEWLSYVHNDDLQIVLQSLDELKAGRAEDHIEFRIIRPDFEIRTIYSGACSLRVNKQLVKITGVNWDITNRKKTELAFQHAKQQAENANRAKSQFLANMSHEIRTPLNAIIGFTELLNEQVTDPKLSSFVKTIQSAGRNLLALINDILDLSKIEAGKLRIEKKVCNPHALFTELGQIFMLRMQERNIDFRMDIDPKIPENLILDATRLRQVLLNLIGNAVKFTEHGHICVRARIGNQDNVRSKLDLLIDVEDAGIGISKDQQELIFNDFEQHEGQDEKKYGGTGLGLSISKRLAEMMGGKITLVSEVGVGSTFTLHMLGVDISSLAMEPEVVEASKNVRFHPANILIVDDVEDNRNLLKECFASTDLVLFIANNGLEAVNIAKTEKLDFILMDIRMPVMDGYEAAEAIKKFCDVPIVALTASVMQDEYERVKSTHFEGYLRKPVLRVDLFSEMMKHLRYEILEEVAEVVSTTVLSKQELQALSNAISELQLLMPKCELISKSNNMTEIENFANNLQAIGQAHQVTVVCEFAINLQQAVDCFDLIVIKNALSTYGKWLEQLTEQLAGSQINLGFGKK